MTLAAAKRAARRLAAKMRCRVHVVRDGDGYFAVFCPSIKRPWAVKVGAVSADGAWEE